MSRRTSLVTLGIGLAAAGVGAVAGVAAERLAVGRPVLRRLPQDEDEVALGSLREVPVVVTSDDGTQLHVEVDEPEQPDPHGLTVVFSHGYALSLDSWHYQRLALQGRVRTVWWDQRGHGRSERGPEGSATIDQVGADLQAVVDATAPTGPLVLVGHSMGGMTVMSLAARNPRLFEERVVGVAFVSTSAGGLADVDLGLHRFGTALRKVAPRALRLLSRSPGLVERTRRIGSDLEEVVVKRWSYASPVSAELLDFTARIIASTRIEVVSDFLPQFDGHDKREVLSSLSGLECLVLTGDHDLMIPTEHSEVIASALPKADFAVVRDGGHLVMLEHPEVVTPHLVALLHRVRERLASDGSAAPLRARQPRKVARARTTRTRAPRSRRTRPQP
ncbi:alpha/beta fold hydrolase [Angustibacter speluncae]